MDDSFGEIGDFFIGGDLKVAAAAASDFLRVAVCGGIWTNSFAFHRREFDGRCRHFHSKREVRTSLYISLNSEFKGKKILLKEKNTIKYTNFI